ncbi:EAL domain-containing protein [Actinomycetes bacterium KLBMP 9797]
MTVDLDDILALAADRDPTPLEQARANRTARWVRREGAKAAAEGRDIAGDVDPEDPLAAGIDEATRIVRAAQLAKVGAVTWVRHTGELAWSDEMSLILGRPPGTVRPSARVLFAAVHPDDATRVRRAALVAWREETVKEFTCRVIRPDGTTRYAHGFLEVVVDADDHPYGLVATVEDVTERELAQRERDRLARRRQTVRASLVEPDPVTGLLTRARFADEIDRALRVGTGALLIVATEPVAGPGASVDADRLAAGVAAFVRKIASPTDICGLVADRELGILMPDTALRPATVRARSIVEGLRAQPFVAGQHRLRMHAWGGLVRYQRQDDNSGFDLIVDGESAWRLAKAQGAALHALDQPAEAEERQELCRSRVRAAVAADSFTLYTQPILDLRLNQITRQEILLRPLDDAGKPVSPSAFLDVAERVGETSAVDRWVIDRTMALIAQGPPTAHYQVNVSALSLRDPDLLNYVCDLMDEHQVDPGQVTFEITESAMIRNLSEALNFARGIQEAGCQLALDDFGTGYGSFTYLKYFPIDLVKIDGVFITEILNSAADQTLVRALVEVCRTFGIQTAAEYVGDQETVDLLRGYGVDFAQGYVVGRPRPIAGAPRSAERSIEIELEIDPLVS